MGDRLEWEITFADSSQAIISTDTASTYSLTNIQLEYETVISDQLANEISLDLSGRVSMLYERIHHHRRFTRPNNDNEWVIDVNQSSRSLKGIVILAHQSQGHNHASECFLPIGATKVEITVEGVPNQTYAQGMELRHFWPKAQRLFAGTKKEDSAESNATCAELSLATINPDRFYTNEFGLVIDMRSTSDNHLHGMGRSLRNTGEGVVIRISRMAGAAGNVDLVVFLLQDGQMNLADERLVDAIW